MTVQTPESTTYSNYAIFPSEPENHFRAIRTEVLTEREQNFLQIDAGYQLGFAGSLVSVRLGVAIGIADDGSIQFEEGRQEAAEAKADLEFMNQQWIEFYTAAKSAFDEIPD